MRRPSLFAGVMFIEQYAKIQKAKAELAAAEAKLAAERVDALSRLPGDYGFSDVNDFIKALKEAYGTSKPKPAKVKASATTGRAEKAKASKGKRAKITDEIKLEVKNLHAAGKTGQEIADTLMISAPTVQNIKKELGLVKPRSATSAADEVAEAAEASPVASVAAVVSEVAGTEVPAAVAPVA